MEPDFFHSLEESFSNVGTDELWVETIGNRKVWLSPIPFNGQAKVQEALSSSNQNVNVINESKRITLSQAIVGIDDIDLRPYRNAGQVFGPVDLPGGKKYKVDLPTYVYMKMAAWGQQFLDDCFAIYADHMETHGKNNVKSVKFENAKNPVDELGELMVRVTELRIQLGLPELVEKGVEPTEDEAQSFRDMNTDSTDEEAPASPSESFDPFKTVKVEAPVSRAVPKASSVPPSVPQILPVPTPVNTLPVSQPPVRAGSGPVVPKLSSADEEHITASSPQNPFVAAPSVESSVIERPVRDSTTPIAPPVIDPVQFGRNPRFNPPKG